MEEDQTLQQQSGRSGSVSRLEITIQRLKDLDHKDRPERSPLPRVPHVKDMYDRYDLGYELHLLRWAAQMTQKEFGHYIGYNKIWVYEVENNRRHPKINTLKKIARAFGLQLKISFELPEEHDGLSLPQDFRRRIRSAQGE
jgi:DNA-binding XRE family transcriptional regulator